MPLPIPTGSEEQSQFNQRCMVDPKVTEEFPDTSQRFAVCNAIWERTKNPKKPLYRNRRTPMENGEDDD